MYLRHPPRFFSDSGTYRRYFSDAFQENLAEKALHLLNENFEELVEERTCELKKAKHAADEANRVKSTFLANMSLDFSKIEAGKLELESRDFSLADTVGSVVRILGLKAK